ncbi:SCF ubiquitin ligase complex subunit cdc4 [Mycoemilia scoparia]|uniref:SCF ubiquitin ligase complex subunit cdc4 n=1 Tax=Mycoemilia scoparia TaxID=417184 RepID=A0A9W7ZTE6_9FUNG|nr:SCF ubiquitin ligase complex subunit cdc4 [Mycoemilia scoparia]
MQHFTGNPRASTSSGDNNGGQNFNALSDTPGSDQRTAMTSADSSSRDINRIHMMPTPTNTERYAQHKVVGATLESGSSSKPLTAHNNAGASNKVSSRRRQKQIQQYYSNLHHPIPSHPYGVSTAAATSSSTVGTPMLNTGGSNEHQHQHHHQFYQPGVPSNMTTSSALGKNTIHTVSYSNGNEFQNPHRNNIYNRSSDSGNGGVGGNGGNGSETSLYISAGTTRTVTTTTVTTTTSMPPLVFPAVSIEKRTNPKHYPLADSKIPPALIEFVSQMDDAGALITEDELGQLENYTSLNPANSALYAGNAKYMGFVGPFPGAASASTGSGIRKRQASPPSTANRVLTPKYTQDDDKNSSGGLLAGASRSNAGVTANRFVGNDGGHIDHAGNRQRPLSLVSAGKPPLHFRSSAGQNNNSGVNNSDNCVVGTTHTCQLSPSASHKPTKRAKPRDDNSASYFSEDADVDESYPTEALLSASSTSSAAGQLRSFQTIIAHDSAKACNFERDDVENRFSQIDAVGEVEGSVNNDEEEMQDINHDDQQDGMSIAMPSDDNEAPLPSPQQSPRLEAVNCMIESDAEDMDGASMDAMSIEAGMTFKQHRKGKMSGEYDSKALARHETLSPASSRGDLKGHAFSQHYGANGFNSADIETMPQMGFGTHGQNNQLVQKDHYNDHQDAATVDLSSLQSIKSILGTYDHLPPNMQSYILFHFLKRTPRDVLQFTAQTLLPVLRRDFIGELPTEISTRILKFMDPKTLCAASCVNKRWHRVINTNRSLWKHQLIRHNYMHTPSHQHPKALSMFNLGEDPKQSILEGYNPPLTELEQEHVSLAVGANKGSRNDRSGEKMSSRQRNSSTSMPFRLWSNPCRDEFHRKAVLERRWVDGKGKVLRFKLPEDGLTVTCIDFDEKYLIVGLDFYDTLVYCVKTGKIIRRLHGHEGGVWTFARAGETLVTGSTDRHIRVWDLNTGECTHLFAGHTSTVRCLKVSLPTDVRTPEQRRNGIEPIYEPQEPIIVSGSRDSTIKVWKLPSPKADPPYHHDSNVQQQGDDSLNVTKVNPYFKRSLCGHTASVRTMAVYGRLVFSGSYDCTVRVWDSTTGTCLHNLKGHGDKVYSVALDPDRHNVFSGSVDCTIRMWNWDTGELLAVMNGHESLVGLLSLHHGSLVSAGVDSALRVWDPTTGENRHTLKRDNVEAITCFQFDGTKLISGAGEAKMWDHRTGKFIRNVVSGVRGIWQTAFTDSKLAVGVQSVNLSYFEIHDFSPELDDEETPNEMEVVGWDEPNSATIVTTNRPPEDPAIRENLEYNQQQQQLNIRLNQLRNIRNNRQQFYPNPPSQHQQQQRAENAIHPSQGPQLTGQATTSAAPLRSNTTNEPRQQRPSSSAQ